MATAITPQQWQQLIDADPTIQTLLKHDSIRTEPQTAVALQALAQRNNVTPPDGYTLDGSSGKVISNGQSLATFGKGAAAILGGVATAGLASPLLASAAAGGGAAASAASSGGQDPYNVPSDPSNPVGTGGPGSYQGVAPNGGSNIWNDITKLGAIAAPVIGAGIQANAAQTAASQQLAATQAALAQQNAQYQQTRTDLGPYRDTGTAANNKLKYLLGLS